MDGFVMISHLDLTVLDRMIKEDPEKADAIVRKTAFQVEAYAKPLAAWETSAMRNSIYVVTSRTSEFNEAAAAALEKRPDAEIVEIPAPTQLGVARVGPCVEYGIYQELGTYKMAAHPFMVPATEMAEKDFIANWEELIK